MNQSALLRLIQPQRRTSWLSQKRRVARKYQVDRKRLIARGERGLRAKNVAMWMIWETGTKSLREIGELFRGLDYAAVAQRIRRTRSTHDTAAARKLIGTMLNV